MTYNLTALSDVTNAADLVLWANTQVDGTLVGMFMLAVFFIMLLALRRAEWEFIDSLAVSSFFCLIVSSLFAYGEFLNLLFPLGFLAITAFSALYLYAR